METEQSAISVRGAYKRYSPSSVVLSGLDLTVREGTIYGLLGPSGCGKTTLLRSIMGLLRLDAGEIHVKAARKSNVGYMPQDLGLYDYMSIMEAFQFYGKLYCMERGTVETRGLNLLNFLELPESDRLIGSLSTGQQRRLSFAVALIHDPDLLILDEPTVGIDPILGAAMWERMLEMSSTGKKTIVITTHYIEEARQAHTIGLMRDGVLLAEQSPNSLMVSQGCESLEEAFLVLSQRQETSHRLDVKMTQEITYPQKNIQVKLSLEDSGLPFAMNRFMAQIGKNATWLLRNLHIAMLLLVMPASIALMIQLMLDNSPIANRAVGVVSPELGKGSATCSTPLSEQPFTCRFMHNMINSSLVPIVYDDLETAKQAVRKNEVWGVLHFSEFYTDALQERIQFDLLSTNDSIVDASFINCYLDMSNMWVSNYMRIELMEDLKQMIQCILQDYSINTKLLTVPIQYNPAIFGTNNPTFLEYIVPGIVCSFAVCLAITFSLGAIMFEKNVGLERSLAAGMTKLEVMSAHCVMQLVIAIVQELVMVWIFYYVYDNSTRGNMPLAFLLLVMLQVMGTFFALVVALTHQGEWGASNTGLGAINVLFIVCALVVALTHQGEWGASNTGLGAINVLFIVCGIIWPVEGMHYILRSIVWAIPVQPAVEAYRAIVMRDWHLSHPVVYKGFLSTTVWTAVFVLGTIALSRRSKSSL